MAAGDGLISMTPTSIAYSGTSASINADGGVDFSAVTSLSLNGVFTGDYDNYLVVFTMTGTAGASTKAVLRAAGTDETGSNYVHQEMSAENTSVSGVRRTETSWRIGRSDSTGVVEGVQLQMYGPALSQPTAARSVTDIAQGGSVALRDFACTHSLSSSYDGITFSPASGDVTGTVHVFGYEE